MPQDKYPVPTPSLVRLRRDVVTTVGTYLEGLHVMATRAESGGWLLHLSLPDHAGSIRTEHVPDEWVRYHGHSAAADELKMAAHEDYRFARTVLGYDDEHATLWLQRGYKKSLKTLREWGFNTTQLEARERAERENRVS